MKEDNNKWRCRFCKKQFPKFKGYEKIQAIEEFTYSVRKQMYERIDNADYATYIDHLHINQGHKIAYCANAICNAGDCEMKTFKSYIARYKHDQRHHSKNKVDMMTEQKAISLLSCLGYVVIKKDDYEKEKYYNKMKMDMEEKNEKKEQKEKEKQEKKKQQLIEKEEAKQVEKEKKDRIENNMSMEVTKESEFNKLLFLNLDYLNLIDDGKSNWNHKIEPFMEELDIDPKELYYDDKTIYLRDEDGDDVAVFKINDEYTFERLIEF